MDRIYWITEVADNWQGPVSLAIYITSPEEWIGLNVLVHFYKKCFAAFRDFVSIHVVIPIDAKFNFSDDSNYSETAKEFIELNEDNASCDSIKQYTEVTLWHFMPQIKERDNKMMLFYPQNHMRNVAKNV
jgi:hypothetical protein